MFQRLAQAMSYIHTQTHTVWMQGEKTGQKTGHSWSHNTIIYVNFSHMRAIVDRYIYHGNRKCDIVVYYFNTADGRHAHAHWWRVFLVCWIASYSMIQYSLRTSNLMSWRYLWWWAEYPTDCPNDFVYMKQCKWGSCFSSCELVLGNWSLAHMDLHLQLHWHWNPKVVRRLL